MDKLKITGGVPLHGVVEIAGAKNAALPIMAAALLTQESLILSNLPHLADISTMAHLLGSMGVKIHIDGNKEGSGHTLILHANKVNSTTAHYDIVRKMRASVIVLGPLLARFSEAKVSLPGGCAIGTRPIDLHLKALEQLGANIELQEGYVHATAPHGLKGAVIEFPRVSVGATENILMAATLAKGETIIKNAALEPEIGDLAECLNKMGANITGIGTDTLTIRGVKKLHGAEHKIIADRIEAGTFAVAAAITRGNILLKGIEAKIMQATLDKLKESGTKVNESSVGISIEGNDIYPFHAITSPYPGLATDMQAQLMALAAVAKGKSVITETIFENRFMHVPELCRMGADIMVQGNSAFITGVDSLTSAQVMATDLRASVSLLLAGLAAKGTTTLNRIYHLDRGYERIEEKLRACGAIIERVKDA